MLAETQLKPENYSESSRTVWESWSPTRGKRLPTMYELPSESPEDDMRNQFHVIQLQFLSETFCPPNYPNDRVLKATDLYLYYDRQNPIWYKHPDWFAVLGVPVGQQQHELRLSYLLWQEQVVPYVILELLSPGTEKADLTLCATPIQVSESGVEALAGGGWHRIEGRGTATGESLHSTG